MTRLIVLLVTLLPLLSSIAFSAPLYHRPGSLDAPPLPTEVHPWRVTAAAPTEARHSIILALAQQNLDVLTALHNDIHDPTHPSWLQHLTPQQLHDITALPLATTDSIIAWLQTHDIAAEDITYPIASDTIRVTSSVRSLNSAFNTTLHAFEHVTTGKVVYRQLGESSLPDEFVKSIDFVEGLHLFPLPTKRHGHIIEWDMSGEGQSKKAAESIKEETVDQSRHTRNSTTGSGPLGVIPQGCGFIGIFPANSLYSHYNMTDLSGSTLPSNPTTSTSTLQLWTADANGNDQANSFSPADLASYSQLWSASGSSSALKVSPISGPNSAANPQDEPTLDTQALGSFNPTAAQSFELTQDNEQFYGWATGFISRTNIPQVVSISYGIPEAIFLNSAYSSQTLDGITLGNYLSRTNTEFMKITARGTTILASSGDDGAAGANSACDYTQAPTSVGGTNYYLYAEFPASSPYVTAVGATELPAACSAFPTSIGTTSPLCSGLTVGTLQSRYGVQYYDGNQGTTTPFHCFAGTSSVTEQAVSVNPTSPLLGSTFNSGGGFSRYFSRTSSGYTDFQSSVIPVWATRSATAGTNPPAAYFNSGNRGIPDVSIFGSQFPLVLSKVMYLAAGTSLSSPLFAAVIGLLNAQTLQARGGTIGWANPLLYQLAASAPNSFKDITSGSNNCPNDFSSTTRSVCVTSPSKCQGFSAVPGWDPVTGLGVPNVGAMQAGLGSLLAANQVTLGTNTGNVSGITQYNGAAQSGSGSAMTIIVAVVSLALTAVLLPSL